MPDVKISDLPVRITAVLRPLGITRSSKALRLLCACIERICEQEDRLEAVQREIYTPISDQRRCKWSAIQSSASVRIHPQGTFQKSIKQKAQRTFMR